MRSISKVDVPRLILEIKKLRKVVLKNASLKDIDKECTLNHMPYENCPLRGCFTKLHVLFSSQRPSFFQHRVFVMIGSLSKMPLCFLFNVCMLNLFYISHFLVY